MAQIRFNVKPSSAKKMQIRAIFQDGKKQIIKNIGETIPSNKTNGNYKYWDNKNSRVRGLEEAGRINVLIDKWKADFTAYKEDCKRLEVPVSAESFIASGSAHKYDKTNTLYSISVSFLASIRSSHNDTTCRSYKVLREQIKKYEQQLKRPLMLTDINRAFYKDFTLYLISEYENTNASILHKQRKIMTMINYAVNDLKIKLPDSDYKKRYTLKTAPSAKYPLRPEEVATLRAHTCATAYQQMVLDAFLLACETGLRHSDIIQLQPAHINSRITPQGIIRYIDLTNMKTDNRNNMPLSDHACKIIDKYFDASHPDGAPCFRFHRSQAAGKVLKLIFKHEDVNLSRLVEVIKMQGSRTSREMKPLYDLISFHMARNTYITRLLSSNLAPAFVKDNAGHSKLDITMSYYRNDDVTRWQETLKILNN